MAKINTDYGAQALDLNQLIDLHGGTGIVSGCSASVGTNAMEVDVASGTARVNGTNYSISASTVTLESSDSNPRKDLVVVDNTGSVTYIKGTPEEAKPAGSTRRNTRRPRPSDISGSDVAVIAEVWVGAGASDIVSGDISDRRLFSQLNGFEDTDGDGVAELHDSHADFQGGDARNVGALDTDEASITGTTGKTINVPSDASTLDAAVTVAAQEIPNRDRGVTINIETGHSISTAVYIEDRDLGHVTITSDDATVPLATGFPTDGDVLRGERAVLPRLETLIDMGGSGRDGIQLQGIASVGQNYGIINAGRYGYHHKGGFARIEGSNFSGAAQRCYLLTQGAQVRMANSDATGSGGDGVFVSRGATVYANGVDASNATGMGIRSHRSVISVQNAIADGCDEGLNVSRSLVEAMGIQIWNAVSDAAVVEDGATASLRSADIDAPGGACLVARRAANVTVEGGSVTNAGNYAVFADSGVNIDATNAVADGYTSGAVEIRKGSTVASHGMTVGGAALATGDTNVSSFNSVTTNGILFN